MYKTLCVYALFPLKFSSRPRPLQSSCIIFLYLHIHTFQAAQFARCVYRTAATLGQNFAQYLFTSTFSDGQLESRTFERLKIWANPEFGTFRHFRRANLNCNINC
jgi:hypothetical protein